MLTVIRLNSLIIMIDINLVNFYIFTYELLLFSSLLPKRDLAGKKLEN